MTLFARPHLFGALFIAAQLLAVGMLMSAAPAPADPAAPGAVDPQAPDDNHASLIELATARYQVATQGYQVCMTGRDPKEAPGPDAIDWMRRRVRARLDMPEPKNDRVAFLKEYVKLLQAQEAFEERMVKSRLSGAEDLLRAQYDRIEGEMLLKQAEAK